MARLVAEGNSITVPSDAAVTRGAYTVQGGFHGLAMNTTTAAGQEVVLDIRQGVFEVVTPAGVGVTVGAALLLSTNGTFGNAAGAAGTGTWHRVGKVKVPRDANGVVHFTQLPPDVAPTVT